MAHWLNPELTTLAFVWRLDRCDGVTLGFTSHDRDLEIDGIVYRATPGMVPSAIEWSDGFDADTVELAGALTSDAIRPDDLAAGRWDGARLTLRAVDWTDPAAPPVALVAGTLGTVTTEGDRFAVELHGPASVLNAPVVEVTSPECRASLGDRRCRVDMAGRSRIEAVAAASGSVLTLATPLPDGAFASGRLRWIDGANAGLWAQVLANAGASVTLGEPPHFDVAAGTRVELHEGCDRRFATCVARFSNAANFRGEPHLPGNDLLTRYAL
jgi:uncharacterized phage protein (TIGR02218 family)